jgi:enhancing lycopene biosynthesis protein 2
MKRVGVLLSGCGVKDGSEIHEAVLALLALDRAGAEAVCLAPNAQQRDVVDHVKGQPSAEQRNMLVEAARIARGKITAVDKVDPATLDALVIPGGFGAAKNLCDYALKGTDCAVRPDVEKLIRAVHQAGKPVGAICIAPALIGKLFGPEGVELTIGSDEGTAGDLRKMGATHVNKRADECHVDRKLKVVTTPAYMCATCIKEAALGIQKLVDEVLKLA